MKDVILIKNIEKKGSRGYRPNDLGGYTAGYNYEAITVSYNNGIVRTINLESVKTFNQFKETLSAMREGTTERSEWYLLLEIHGWPKDNPDVKIRDISTERNFIGKAWSKIESFNAMGSMPAVGIGDDFEKICPGLYGQYARLDNMFGSKRSTMFIVEIRL